ncbi:hypothetical protein P691DRAFT_810327 [Macrolepiota fuliginosa MF-IS2]|uniref:Uncharacterized protein n=1 Tax=Macrolepiota fuliginosa MF-IS2 TaxID=1400762 RepID=A0A9P5X4D3_9AGAR|nr:hypothetical protein P691DRAFT_810327 [Macrolepiota fuliginosa MF-IS2]
MKDLVGDAVGNVSFCRRRGIFTLNLESPLEVPRFLPQRGTWDCIVSTSSEKLKHILKSHYHAITDINWHTTECDTVASTSSDSWIYAWDLREPQRPIIGFSAFKGTVPSSLVSFALAQL